MNNLVAALLSLARNDAGAGDLKLEQVNFNVLFEQTLGTLSMLAEQKGLKLAVLPQCTDCDRPSSRILDSIIN